MFLSLAVCAVLQAWKADTNGHTYQLFVLRGMPPGIAATAGLALESTLTTRNRLTSRSSGPSPTLEGSVEGQASEVHQQDGEFKPSGHVTS
jgi:hypothetical protein